MATSERYWVPTPWEMSVMNAIFKDALDKGVPEVERRRRRRTASQLAGAFVAGFAAAMVVAQVRGLNSLRDRS